MAIYHLHVKVLKRSEGKNAVASAAYRRATKLFDEKEQKEWDYSHKLDVIHSELLIPDNAPKWVKELFELHATDSRRAIEKLWNLVEKWEKRKDAQVGREVEFSLPIELDPEQGIVLARAFIKDQFVSRGMLADWNVHWDKGNPHVHVMLTMRELTEKGFGLKVREWNQKSLLEEWRRQWTEYANFHLRLHQQDAQIDHRSYREQGIELLPGIHQGKAVADMERRGIATDLMREANAIRRENLKRIAAKPSIVFDKLSHQCDSFTREHLAQELGRYINDQGKFLRQAGAAESPFLNAEPPTEDSPTEAIQRGLLADRVLQDFNAHATQDPHPEGLTAATLAQILARIEHHESVFSERAIAQAVAAFTENADEFARAVLQIKASPELLHLGAGDDGRDRFTTRTMFRMENTLQQITDTLRDRRHVKLPRSHVQTWLRRHQNQTGQALTDEQRTAVEHILQPACLRCVVGRAGTGKSFLLGAAKTVWEARGLGVHGVALSGIAADGLSKDAGIASRTIESFRYALAQGTLVLTAWDVVVMDEAGMTDSRSLLAVLEAVQAAGAKLVLVGDPAQLQPVGPGASFRALLERLGFAQLQTVYRQKTSWQRDATVALSAGRVSDALIAYAAHDDIHIEPTADQAMALLTQDWLALRAQHDQAIGQFLVIAHRNEDVAALNQRLRAERVSAGEIAEGYRVQTQGGEIHIAQGDRLLFLKNDRRLGVSNGRFATVQSVRFTESGRVLDFRVVLDGTDQEVSIDPRYYSEFAYGYAATVHKVQGITVDYVFVYGGGYGWNRYLTTVAFTRHRHRCAFYGDQTTYPDEKALNRRLGRLGMKDSLLDFPLAFAERRGMDSSERSAPLSQHLSQRVRAWKEKLSDQYEQTVRPEAYAQRQRARASDRLSAEAITQRREDARWVAAYVDSHQAVGMAWQALQVKLTALGLSSLSYEAQAFALISGTSEYAALQSAYRTRDAHAFRLMRDPSRYEKAMAIYRLDNVTLTRQAERHVCYERVQAYATACQKEGVVLRDRLAAEMAHHMKAHYPYLRAFQLEGRVLRGHALSHTRRQLFMTLSAEERAAFKVVEAYQSAAQALGAGWSSQELLQHRAWVRLEQLGQVRDRLAHRILADRARFEQALGFYRIGLATPRFGEAPSAEHLRQADLRLQRLEAQATRHVVRERVTLYHRALFLGDKERLALAHAIVQEAKAHHGAVVGLGVPTSALWSAIRQDAQRYALILHYRGLNASERAGFKMVAAYVKAKKAHAQAWREIFESQSLRSVDEKTLIAQLAGHVATDTQTRNRLAAEILTQPAVYQAGLNYFKIALPELQPPAYRHACRVAVEAYREASHPLLRAEQALVLVADPKAHHGSVVENGLCWRAIYRDAALAQRRQHFAGLSREEKSLYRLAERYREANQTAGRVYSRFKAKADDKLSVANTIRIDHLFAKRDYLAWRLVHNASALGSGVLTEVSQAHRLNPDKVLQQCSAHDAARPAFQRIDVQRLRQDLNAQAEAVTQHYLGEPKTRSGHTWRYGSHHGSLVVTVRGAKQGLWCDFQTQTGGDMLGLIQQALGTSEFKPVLQEGVRFLGGGSTYVQPVLTSRPSQDKTVAVDAYTQRRVQQAQAIYAGTQPLIGTLAEPQKPENQRKWDFNDALLAEGIERVAQDLDQARLYAPGVTPQSIAQGIQETVATLDQQAISSETAAAALDNTQPTMTAHDLQTMQFEAILLHYVEMEEEQTRLVYAMHNTRVSDPAASQLAFTQALTNKKTLEHFVNLAVTHPEIAFALEALKKIRPASLAQRGGFMAIHGRMRKGERLKEDTQAVLAQLRGRVMDQSRARSEDRSRGGRSR